MKKFYEVPSLKTQRLQHQQEINRQKTLVYNQILQKNQSGNLTQRISQTTDKENLLRAKKGFQLKLDEIQTDDWSGFSQKLNTCKGDFYDSLGKKDSSITQPTVSSQNKSRQKTPKKNFQILLQQQNSNNTVSSSQLTNSNCLTEQSRFSHSQNAANSAHRSISPLTKKSQKTPQANTSQPPSKTISLNCLSERKTYQNEKQRERLISIQNPTNPTHLQTPADSHDQDSRQRFASPKDSYQITEKDTLNFMKKNYGQDRMNWPYISTENFVRQLFREYQDVLDDHEISQELLKDLELKIINIIDSETNPGFICLQKLQQYTQLTGPLGLVIQALKEQESEQQLKQQQTTCQGYLSSGSFESQQHMLKSLNEFDALAFQQRDIQNIKNVLQEFMEGIYRQMDDTLAKKYQYEHRRLVLKQKQVEKLVQYVKEKMRDNFELFAQERENKQRRQEMLLQVSDLQQRLELAEFKHQKSLQVVEVIEREKQQLELENEKLRHKLDSVMRLYTNSSDGAILATEEVEQLHKNINLSTNFLNCGELECISSPLREFKTNQNVDLFQRGSHEQFRELLNLSAILIQQLQIPQVGASSKPEESPEFLRQAHQLKMNQFRVNPDRLPELFTSLIQILPYLREGLLSEPQIEQYLTLFYQVSLLLFELKFNKQYPAQGGGGALGSLKILEKIQSFNLTQISSSKFSNKAEIQKPPEIEKNRDLLISNQSIINQIIETLKDLLIRNNNDLQYLERNQKQADLTQESKKQQLLKIQMILQLLILLHSQKLNDIKYAIQEFVSNFQKKDCSNLVGFEYLVEKDFVTLVFIVFLKTNWDNQVTEQGLEFLVQFKQNQNTYNNFIRQISQQFITTSLLDLLQLSSEKLIQQNALSLLKTSSYTMSLRGVDIDRMKKVINKLRESQKFKSQEDVQQALQMIIKNISC